MHWNWNEIPQGNNSLIMSAIKEGAGDPALWHRRLGHVPMKVLRKIKEFNTGSNFTIDHCHICP